MKTSAKYFALADGPRSGNVSQNDLKTTSLMTSLTTPNQKIFFRVQTRRLIDPFKPMNSSSAIGRGVMALVR